MNVLTASTPFSHPSPLDHSLHVRIALPLLALLIALPPIASAFGGDFYIALATRVLIFALAATSLNLILGFGGMISFGHAAFLGIGAYTVAVLMQHGTTSAWIAWPLAIAVSALAALLIGAISLRTRGVYFIMITLAFAQMLYYLAISLPGYGGDDGLSLKLRSTIATGVDLTQDTAFYYLVLCLCAAAFVLLWRLINSRFGHVLQAVRENETRMAAVGFPVSRYKLIAFTLAGACAGLAGALAANQSGIASPAMMHWSQSGLLMVMVILGGVGHLYGGIVGAAVLLLAEEVMQAYTIHWQFGLGAVLLAVVLIAPRGLLGFTSRD